ncbi:MFS transporter [Novosphingobium umbonatum]|uniref:MFS transporter n=1 Tax=Novosphingobium umbonatum TaxID=1908524 RepID=A0A3S2YB68_9SPHN|nr:MFS transporter [Novosphingobium umbonatum]RVU07664.1 MFS transporter [Novosphingobium umbonatum]
MVSSIGSKDRQWAAPLAAVLGCLQPAIDPVFLALASSATGLRAQDHGWVVGATQAAAALGAVLVWWLGLDRRAGAGRFAASLALMAALLTPLADGLVWLLCLRAAYGLGMGAIYASAMGAYAARLEQHAAKAYGVVMLAQLLLASAISPVLPIVADDLGADGALWCLVLVPALALLAAEGVAPCSAALRHEAVRQPTPIAGWALALGTFWFICATMMVWSLSGGLAMAAGLGHDLIGRAVSLGSLAGAATAWVVMRRSGRREVVPLALQGLLAGMAVLSPMWLIRPDGGAGFVGSMVLLNIGSTAMIILCSGLASAAGRDSRFRVLVAATHNLGMTAGPALGSALVWADPQSGVLTGAALAIGLAVLAVGMAGWQQRPPAIRPYVIWRIGAR